VNPCSTSAADEAPDAVDVGDAELNVALEPVLLHVQQCLVSDALLLSHARTP
jgi:hypothetical protein